MFIDLKHKTSFWGSIVTLVVIFFVTCSLCYSTGLETGLFLGTLGYFIFGGLESTLYLCSRKLHRRFDDVANDVIIQDSYSSSEDNPTIR